MSVPGPVHIWPNVEEVDERMDGWMDGWMEFLLHVLGSVMCVIFAKPI